MSYIDLTANVVLFKNKAKWNNEHVEFWKEEEYDWCFRREGKTWNYGYKSLKDAIISYTMSLTEVEDPDVKITGSMLIDKDYKQENAWNKNDESKKVSSINCSVVVRRFIA